jgi:NAD(P)-dependent dehydrogenase (short-subunit alcohol dehydrogenase family)
MNQHEPSETPLSELTSLAGQVAVVTGAAHGVGTAIATRLAEAGARVVLADLDTTGAHAAAATLRSAHDGDTIAIGAGVDVSSSTSTAALVALTLEHFGRLDIWVNNAGIYPRAGLLSMTDDQWSKVLDINLNGVFYGSRAAANAMVARPGGGVIVNVSSASAFRAPATDLAHYAASKAGVVGLTRALATELGPHHIRVLSVAPILVTTANALTLLQEHGGADAVAATAARVPLRKVPQADDIARVVFFAVSGLAGMVTGSTLLVDGGQLST